MVQSVNSCAWLSLQQLPVKKVECVLDECGQEHVLEGQCREVVVEEQYARDDEVRQGVHSPTSQQEGACKGELEELDCRDRRRGDI